MRCRILLKLALAVCAAALCGCRGEPNAGKPTAKPAEPRSAPPADEPGLRPIEKSPAPTPEPSPPPTEARPAPPPAPEPPRQTAPPRPPSPPVPPPPPPPPPSETKKLPPLTEEEKIDRLIKAVADSGVVFVRNGKEHTAAEAGDHLRAKRKYAGGKIKTAKDFIEQLASRSSMSGKPYLIKTADGKETPSGQWLTERLQKLEKPETE